jgi:hypothetical protein
MSRLIEQLSKKEVQITNKCIKKCPASLSLKEMQIKVSLGLHLIPVRIAVIKKTNNNKCCLGWKGGTLYTLIVGMQSSAATTGINWRLHKETEA